MKTSTNDLADRQILVAGTGPAGMIAALAFSAAGFDVVLVGPPVRTDDRRTTALMAPALSFLESLGIGDELADKSAPLKAMRIVDGTSRLVRGPVVTFRAAEIGEAAFGYNIPNAHLNAVLEQHVTAASRIAWVRAMVDDWHLGADAANAALSDGTTISVPLVVAADGRGSPARRAAGIATADRPHRQSAFVTVFAHSRDHHDISTEFHTESGPFTQVPLPGRRSSLVWVVRPEEGERLGALDAARLSRTIEDRMQSMLGKIEVDGSPQLYPLSASLPHRFAANRVVLTGEAAHLFPPIGAQGLNLGIRDVSEAVRVAGLHRGDPGAPAALDAYDRARRPDILARTAAVELLNRSLLSDFLPTQLVRSAGLAVLGRSSPLRGFFMREGLRAGSGFRSVFADLREKVGR